MTDGLGASEFSDAKCGQKKQRAGREYPEYTEQASA